MAISSHGAQMSSSPHSDLSATWWATSCMCVLLLPLEPGCPTLDGLPIQMLLLGSDTPHRPVLICVTLLTPLELQHTALGYHCCLLTWMSFSPFSGCNALLWSTMATPLAPPHGFSSDLFGKVKKKRKSSFFFFLKFVLLHRCPLEYNQQISNEPVSLVTQHLLPLLLVACPDFFLWWSTLFHSQYMCFRQDWLHPFASAMRWACVSPGQFTPLSSS